MATHDNSSLLELSTRASTLGSSISTRMLEFLRTVPRPPLGFKELGLEFLETAQILSSITAGLTEFLKTSGQFPADMVSELRTKFTQTIEDFVTLDGLLKKFLDFEKGGVTATVMKTWRLFVADKDVARVRASLAKEKEALKMTMLVFNWSRDYHNVPVGSEYQNLAAELARSSSQASNNTGAPSEYSTAASSLVPSELEGTSVMPSDQPIGELDDTSIPAHSLPVAPTQTQPVSALSEQMHGLQVSTSTSATSPMTDLYTATPKSSTAHSSEKAEPELQDVPAPAPEPTAQQSQDEPPPAYDAHGGQAAAAAASAQEVGLKRVNINKSTLTYRKPANPAASNPPALKTALVSAAQGKRHGVMTQLLDRGVPPDTVPPGKSALREAVAQRDLDGMRLLLEFGADPDLADGDRQTPLCTAADLRFDDGAKLLLDWGADPNAPGAFNAPLAAALSARKMSLVQLCLTYGADPNLVVKSAPAPMTAACGVSLEFVKVLVDYGGDVNGKGFERSPLNVAMDHNKADVLEFLLKQGADPNVKAPQFVLLASLKSPVCLRLLLAYGADVKKCPGILELAAVSGIAEVVDVLIDAGADPNEKKDRIFLPLTTAIRDNKKEVFELLLRRGADPNHNGGPYPLEVACARPQYIQPLLSAGADIKKVQGLMEYAVVQGNLEAVQILLDAGVDPNEKKNRIFLPLTSAIRDNRKEIFDLLVKRGADLDLRGGPSPLEAACERPQYIKPLLAAGADPKKVVGLLEKAVSYRNTEAVRILLEAGIDPNEPYDRINWPITSAIFHNKPEILALLLAKGAKTDVKGPDYPIFLAAKSPGMLKQLIEAGASLKQPSGLAERAVFHNNMEVLELAVANGVDLNEKWQNTHLPIVTAASHNRTKMLTYLLKHGADPNLKGPELPLHAAVTKPECFSILMASGANPKLCTGITELAVYHNKIECVKLLLGAGVDIDEKQHSIFTPLTTAIRENRPEMVTYLLGQGANPNYVGEHLPLVMAARRGDVNMVQMLLDKGADVNLAHRDWTALMQAVDSNKAETVKLLLGNGADTNAKDGLGRTPLDIAANKGHDEMIVLMLEYM